MIWFGWYGNEQFSSEKLVNCGYLDITEDDFPEMKLCWDGKNINILLVTETTYDWLVEKINTTNF